MDIFEDIARLSACEWCGAPSGIPCATKNGRRITTVHGARWYAASTVIRRVIDYYCEKQQKALDDAAQAITAQRADVQDPGRPATGG
jgi:hypothetical protein